VRPRPIPVAGPRFTAGTIRAFPDDSRAHDDRPARRASSALVHAAGIATSTAGTSSAANQLTGTWRQTVVPAAPEPTGEHFISDPQTGQFLGTHRISRTIELAADGHSFTAIATVTTLDPAGNVLGTGTAIAGAERMEVES
jgi:hypothetical protein